MTDYDIGYRDGEASCSDDWQRAFTDTCDVPDELLDAGPSEFAAWVVTLQAANEALRDRVTELGEAITAYMLGIIDGSEVSRVQHHERFPIGGGS